MCQSSNFIKNWPGLQKIWQKCDFLLWTNLLATPAKVTSNNTWRSTLWNHISRYIVLHSTLLSELHGMPLSWHSCKQPHNTDQCIWPTIQCIYSTKLSKWLPDDFKKQMIIQKNAYNRVTNIPSNFFGNMHFSKTLCNRSLVGISEGCCILSITLVASIAAEQLVQIPLS